MWKYTVKRMLMMIPTLIGAGFLVFFLMRLVPGDICALRLSGTGGFADPEAVRVCHEQLGLDQPHFIQFVSWIWNFFQFDFGMSMWTGRPIDRKSTRLNPVTNAQLVCRLLLDK